MKLYKNIDLKVDGYTIELSDDIKLYKNDAIDLIFSIYEYGINPKSRTASKEYMPIESLNAKLLIETPFGVDSVEAANVVDNTITFHLTKEYTQNIGFTKVSIVLLGEDDYKSTLPEFKFEVRKSINEKWDGENVVYPTILLDDNGNIILVDDNTAVIR